MSARKSPSAKDQPIAQSLRGTRPGRSRAFYYSILLHATLILVVVIGIDWKSSTVITPAAAPNIMQATAVDASKVAEEVRKLESAEQQKLAAERKRQEDAEKRVQEEERKLAQIKEAQEVTRREKEQENRKLEAEKKRLETENEQAALAKQKAEAEKKKVEAEAQRAAEKRQQVEAEAAAEAKKKAAAEEKKKAAAEEKKKAAAEEKEKAAAEEKKRAAEEAKKKAEEKMRQQAAEAEAALKEALAAEEAALQASQDATELQRYMGRIQAAISGGFVYPPGLPPGLKCTLFVRVIPGGEVVEARVVQSSGNPVFDRQAETAVRKAAPLPVPDEPRLMQQMREFNFVFEPES